MESKVHLVLLWLYHENQWLYIIYTPQRVTIFRGRRVSFYLEGKTHQTQLINTPKLQIFSETPSPQPTIIFHHQLQPSLYILSVYIQHFLFVPHSYFQFFLYLLLSKHTYTDLKPQCVRSLRSASFVYLGNNKYCRRYNFLY